MQTLNGDIRTTYGKQFYAQSGGATSPAAADATWDSNTGPTFNAYIDSVTALIGPVGGGGDVQALVDSLNLFKTQLPGISTGCNSLSQSTT